MDNSKPVDQADLKTVDVRQGTGPRATCPSCCLALMPPFKPRATVSVLLVSLLMAAAAGVVILGYFYWVR